MIQTEELRIIDDKETLVIIRKPINLSSQDRYGFEFTANYTPFKWWRISNNFNFYKFVTDGSFESVNYDSNDVSWFNRLNSRKRKSTDFTPTTISVGEFQWRERQILLNFTYRFNQKKKRKRQQRNYNGGEEEMFKA